MKYFFAVCATLSSNIVFGELPKIPTEGLHGNNRTYANYLNTSAPISTRELFLDLEGSALKSALESAAPTRNGFTPFMADIALFTASSLVVDHLQAQRLFHATPSPIPVAFAGELENENLTASRAPVGMIPPAKPKKWNVWAEGVGQYAYEKEQKQSPNFGAGTWGGIFSASYRFSDTWLAGAGASYIHTFIHEGDDVGKVYLDQGLLAFYGEAHVSRYYANVGLWGSYYDSRNKRFINFSGVNSTAKSKPHGWQFLPHLEFGGDYKWTHLTLEPFAMFDWANNWQSSLTESGAAGLDVFQKRHYSSMLRSEAGFRFYESFQFSWGTFTLLEKASYVNKKPFKVGSISAFLVGSPGSFTVETLSTPQNLGLGELEFIFDPRANFYPKCTINYQGEFSIAYQSHTFSAYLTRDF